MKHVVSFSTGLSSALTVERVLSRYGKENSLIVFMDTLIEDEDNYRFMAEAKKRWGVEIVTLTEGRTPFEVSKDAQIIPNQKIAPCTFRLKIDIFTKFVQDIEGDVTIHIGYDYSELHRIETTRKNYEERGWAVDFPLLWKPYEMRPYEQVVREDWGIEPPRMYSLGYTHANCGGVCVKQGQGDWRRTLVNFPARYAEIEAWEEKMRNHPIRKKYALLRDQSGGKVRALTLAKFRNRNEEKESLSLFELDYQSPCVHCGVGDLAATPEQLKGFGL